MNGQTKNHIPIRFVDEESSEVRSHLNEDEQTRPEEQSAAETESDIDQPPEQKGLREHERAEEQNVVGALRLNDVPKTSNNPNTASDVSDQSFDVGVYSDVDVYSNEARTESAGQPAEVGSGPAFAELLAARAELSRVEAELRKANAERQDATERVLRLQADFENHRKRLDRERSETYNRVLGELVNRLLPVTDNLRRALDAQNAMQRDISPEFRHFLQGIDLINKQISGLLESLGVQTVATVGQPFDPHIHEAAAAEQTDQFPPDTIIAEIVPGYVLGGKLLRPAVVKVATR